MQLEEIKQQDPACPRAGPPPSVTGPPELDVGTDGRLGSGPDTAAPSRARRACLSV